MCSRLQQIDDLRSRKFNAYERRQHGFEDRQHPSVSIDAWVMRIKLASLRILMASPAEPVTGALFRALRTSADPDLAHAAEAEVRQIASQNVIAEMKAGFTEVNARIDAVGSRVDALGSRIDTLQKVIWPLIVLLTTTVFGLLYRVPLRWSCLGGCEKMGRL